VTGKTSLYVAELARKHGVVYVRTPDDELADVISRLSDADVVTDETEDLIVALKRAGIINGAEMVSLLGRHDEVMISAAR
jgi:hypothetical protein